MHYETDGAIKLLPIYGTITMGNISANVTDTSIDIDTKIISVSLMNFTDVPILLISQYWYQYQY